jgi:hypothetical protein
MENDTDDSPRSYHQKQNPSEAKTDFSKEEIQKRDPDKTGSVLQKLSHLHNTHSAKNVHHKYSYFLLGMFLIITIPLILLQSKKVTDFLNFEFNIIRPQTVWLTYKNAQFGYSFDYPKGWQIIEQDAAYHPPEMIHWLTMDRKIQQPVNRVEFNAPWADWIRITPGLHIMITSKQVSDINRTGYNCNLETEGCMFLFEHSQANFQGIPARLTQPRWPGPEVFKEIEESFGENIIPYTYYSFEHKGYYWTIAFTHSDFSGKYDPAYNSMLSSFKFTE